MTTFDLIEHVHIDPSVAELATTEEGREKLEIVAACFGDYPAVLDWIMALAGVGQPLLGDGGTLERNVGKQELGLQILMLLAASDITEDQARQIIEEHEKR